MWSSCKSMMWSCCSSIGSGIKNTVTYCVNEYPWITIPAITAAFDFVLTGGAFEIGAGILDAAGYAAYAIPVEIAKMAAVGSAILSPLFSCAAPATFAVLCGPSQDDAKNNDRIVAVDPGYGIAAVGGFSTVYELLPGWVGWAIYRGGVDMSFGKATAAMALGNGIFTGAFAVAVFVGRTCCSSGEMKEARLDNIVDMRRDNRAAQVRNQNGLGQRQQQQPQQLPQRDQEVKVPTQVVISDRANNSTMSSVELVVFPSLTSPIQSISSSPSTLFASATASTLASSSNNVTITVDDAKEGQKDSNDDKATKEQSSKEKVVKTKVGESGADVVPPPPSDFDGEEGVQPGGASPTFTS
jgi:hypothetical protein